MIAQTRSELLKLRTTRMLPLLLLAAVAMSLFGVLIEGLSRDVNALTSAADQRDLLSKGVTIAVFFATLAGLLSVTAEYRYGTIRPTLLVQPRRHIVLAAKLAAAAVTGVVFAVACVAASFGAWAIVMQTQDASAALTSTHVLGLIFGPVAASALSAMIGVALGALIRNQAGAIIALAVYALVVDAGLFSAAPEVGQYLPGKAGDALAGRPVELLLAPALGALLLALWAVLFAGAALVRDRHRDV